MKKLQIFSCGRWRRLSLFLVLALLFAWDGQIQAQPCPACLDGVSHPKFVNSLPDPVVINKMSGGAMDMYMGQTVQHLGLYADSEAQTPLYTNVWGYGPSLDAVSYPGPTILAMENRRLNVRWINELPNEHLLPVDESVHWAHYHGYPSKGIPVVAHLHGGHTESASDGLPEAWFTRNWSATGKDYVKKVLRYDNTQEAATLWYHDHALGITRLNVYAGLAGFYLLRDNNELGLIADGVLPSGPYEKGVVVQDRQFTQEGQLRIPSSPEEVGEMFEYDGEVIAGLPEVTAAAEFFGDFILVNGVAWPYLNVEPRKYRFRLLNGSDSRFYIFAFDADISFIQIGTDNGFLPFPVDLNEAYGGQLLLAPGERADIVVDFSGHEGQSLGLLNFGPDGPFKGVGVDDPSNPESTGQIIKFNVTLPLSGTPDATVDDGTRLRGDIEELISDLPVRRLALFEGEDEYGRLQPMLGVAEPTVDASGQTANGSLTWNDPITENIMLNDVEIWEIYNATEDAHPIHLHLVSFQILDRQPFEPELNTKDQLQHNGEIGVGGVLENEPIEFSGPPVPPGPNEKGWKDTGIAPPDMVTRVIARFDRKGLYVWHCHILSHEDHEMMRPFFVGRTGRTGQEEEMAAMKQLTQSNEAIVFENMPNPFSDRTVISLNVPESTRASVAIYDLKMQEVRVLMTGHFEAGSHTLTWDGTDHTGAKVSAGTYIGLFRTSDSIVSRTMMLVR